MSTQSSRMGREVKESKDKKDRLEELKAKIKFLEDCYPRVKELPEYKRRLADSQNSNTQPNYEPYTQDNWAVLLLNQHLDAEKTLANPIQQYSGSVPQYRNGIKGLENEYLSLLSELNALQQTQTSSAAETLSLPGSGVYRKPASVDTGSKDAPRDSKETKDSKDAKDKASVKIREEIQALSDTIRGKLKQCTLTDSLDQAIKNEMPELRAQLTKLEKEINGLVDNCPQLPGYAEFANGSRTSNPITGYMGYQQLGSFYLSLLAEQQLLQQTVVEIKAQMASRTTSSTTNSQSSASVAQSTSRANFLGLLQSAGIPLNEGTAAALASMTATSSAASAIYRPGSAAMYSAATSVPGSGVRFLAAASVPASAAMYSGEASVPASVSFSAATSTRPPASASVFGISAASPVAGLITVRPVMMSTNGQAATTAAKQTASNASASVATSSASSTASSTLSDAGAASASNTSTFAGTSVSARPQSQSAAASHSASSTTAAAATSDADTSKEFSFSGSAQSSGFSFDASSGERTNAEGWFYVKRPVAQTGRPAQQQQQQQQQNTSSNSSTTTAASTSATTVSAASAAQSASTSSASSASADSASVPAKNRNKR